MNLREVLAENRAARLIENDIYSTLPDTSTVHHYDRRAAVYDLVVSTRLYNYAMWGTTPSDYVAFARDALRSSSSGIFLDAGCGSLLFTASTYVDSQRSIIAFDQSLAMLRRARQRFVDLCGRVPENIRLLQADLSDLPFSTKRFGTVLCLNVLHQVANAATLIENLKQLLHTNGNLYLTSLVMSSRAIGDYYLKALSATGEFVRPRSKVELKELLDTILGSETNYRVKGNMAFVNTNNGRENENISRV